MTRMTAGRVERLPTQGPRPSGVVLITCRLLLISQAVGAALRGRGLDTRAVSWSEGVRRATEELTEADDVLLLDDLADRSTVEAIQSLITHSSARFLVLTHSPQGATWGAMLSSGAAGVMSNDSSLVEVESALTRIREGRSLCTEVQRSQLMREWSRWLEADDAVRARLENLSPREREILDLLSVGVRVGDIVADLGVAETTVRSHIRSVRRKLDVGSQLAAVAVVHRLGGGTTSTLDARQPPLPGPRRPGPDETLE